MAIAEEALKGAPEAIRQTKQFIECLYPSSFSEDLKQALDLHQQMRHSKEAKEGIQAFLEDRQPNWLQK